MDKIGKLIEFDSPAFPCHPRDEDLPNSEVMHGFALARFIGQNLPRFGFKIVDYYGEDWGWHCQVENDGYELMYGVCGMEETEFLIQFSPTKPVIRRWFKKIDVSERLTALQNAVFEILASDERRTVGPIWSEEF